MLRLKAFEKLMLLVLFVMLCCVGNAGAVKWRFQSPLSPGDDGVKIWKMFVDKVAEYSKGELTMELLLAGSSGISQAQYLAAYSQNLVECGDLLSIMHPGELGNWVHISSLNGWVFRSPRAVVDVQREIRPIFADALKKHGVIMLSFLNAVLTADGVAPIFSRKELRNEDDFKGLRLRIPGEIQKQYIWSKLGVNAVAIPLTDLYLAMSRGLCDAAKSGTQRMLALRINEVAPYLYVDTYVASLTPAMIVCSKLAFDSLSESAKAALLKAGQEVEKVFWEDIFWNPGKYGLYSEEKAMREAQSKGMKLAALPDKLIDKLAAFAYEGMNDLAQKSGAEGMAYLAAIRKANERYREIESPIHAFLKTVAK